VTVVDTMPADKPTVFQSSPGMAPDGAVAVGLGDETGAGAPGRCGGSIASHAMAPIVRRAPAASPPWRHLVRTATVVVTEPAGVEIAYKTVDWAPADSGRITEAL
jgi:hypothetical protein